MYIRKHPAPPIGRFLRGADLPPFVTERWRQKCPQGTSVGIGRRFSLSGHKRLRCFARPLRALAPLPSLLPLFSQCDPAGRRPAMCGRKRIIVATRSAPSLRLAKKREEEQAAAAPLKARARVCPHSILGTAVGGSLTFRLADAFGTTFCP